ncbi:hypothetical protein ACXYRO_01385 [Mycoplasma sp. 4013]
MELLKIKEMFLKIAESIPGIMEINPLSDDDIVTDTTELIDRVNIIQTPKGYSFFIAVSLIADVFAKVIIAEFHQRLAFEMKKNKLKFNKLTIFIEGIK